MRIMTLTIAGEPVAQPRYVQTQTKQGRPINLIRRRKDGSPHPVHAYKADIQAAFFKSPSRWPTPKKEHRACWELKVIAIFGGRPRELAPEFYNLRGRNDGDNVMKAIKDALNGLAWYDDGEVVSEEIVRLKAWQPMTIIQLTELAPSDHSRWSNLIPVIIPSSPSPSRADAGSPSTGQREPSS